MWAHFRRRTNDRLETSRTPQVCREAIQGRLASFFPGNNWTYLIGVHNQTSFNASKNCQKLVNKSTCCLRNRWRCKPIGRTHCGSPLIDSQEYPLEFAQPLIFHLHKKPQEIFLKVTVRTLNYEVTIMLLQSQNLEFHGFYFARNSVLRSSLSFKESRLHYKYVVY